MIPLTTMLNNFTVVYFKYLMNYSPKTVNSASILIDQKDINSKNGSMMTLFFKDSAKN